MPPIDLPRYEMDGRRATAEDLFGPVLRAYGHFTAMQVRAGRVRGLALHLARLDAANRELFGVGLDGELIRDRIRHALGDDVRDASVRVQVYPAGGGDATTVLVAVRPPKAAPNSARRLASVPYQRSVAEVKHIGDFGQAYYQRLARRGGHDDALLVAADGTVSETATANIGFFDGATVVWPEAPLLAGITMQLLVAHGPESERRPVRVADLPSFAGVFVANSRGIAAVSHLDGIELPSAADRTEGLIETYEALTGDLI
ncbi:aminotransferase class IV [Streptomyces sp. NPDC000134]|uniref:aminotransferase class IV n=1 Tax=Streptomyces sp. NPDC000134 TaxID=3364536 RepID=UPI0036C06C40